MCAGIAPDKLYQSWLVYDADEVTLSTLMAGQTYYVCVDSFNKRHHNGKNHQDGGLNHAHKSSPAIYAGNRFKQRKRGTADAGRHEAAGYDGIELCGFMIHPSALWCGC
ncbi:MAG: hypothetical protein ACLRNA_10295 [Gemmiger formicilis]|uniref:hypothetical protein n=1 Tax=Gemmiger formicilis TaxID=745368 RepID=UPI003A2F13A1